MGGKDRLPPDPQRSEDLPTEPGRIRRSIRFFDTDRPVEREKIQKILEAMRIASCAVNAHWLRAVVTGDLGTAAHVVLAILMLLGRLEFYTLLVLVIPSTWQKWGGHR